MKGGEVISVFFAHSNSICFCDALYSQSPLRVQIAYVRECLCACMCVCLPLKLLLTISVMWCDMDPIWLVKQATQIFRLLSTPLIGMKGVCTTLICGND